MTVYIRFIELGTTTWLTHGGKSPRLLQIGNSGDTLSRFLVYKPSGGSDYGVWHSNSISTQVAGTVSLSPAIGNRIELAAQLYADGAVQIHGSKNGGTTSSGTKSSALTFDPAWAASTVYIGCINTAGAALSGIEVVYVVRGVHSLDTMRKRAGN
jgi:hypothetical protein